MALVAALALPTQSMDRDSRLRRYGPIIVEAFTRHKVPPVWGLAIARQESDFQPSAKNLVGGDATRGGSFGLLQMSLMTARALRGKDVEPEQLLDPAYNADISAELVAQLAKRFKFVLSDVAAAYNSGKPWTQAPTTTQKTYVPNVLRYVQLYAPWATEEEQRCKQAKLSTG